MHTSFDSYVSYVSSFNIVEDLYHQLATALGRAATTASELMELDAHHFLLFC